MFKKLLCGVVAAAMVMTVAPVLPANTTVADAAMIEVKAGTILGKEDRTSAFWSDVTKGLKLGDGETLTAEFENHGSTANNWENYTFAFMNAEDMDNSSQARVDKTYMEYAIVRSDNYAVGGDWTNKVGVSYDEKAITFNSDVNWDTWKDIVKDSNVVITMDRVQNLVSVKEVITNIADPTKKITTTTVISVGKAKDDTTYNDNVYVGFTIDKAYLKFSKLEVAKTVGDVQITPPPAGGTGGTVTPGTGGTGTETGATKKAKFTVKKGKKKVSSVTVKKGKKVTLSVSVVPKKAKLSLTKLTKKQKKIASVTFKKGKLTIKGKKKGNITVKITSSKSGEYKKTTKSIKVKVK